MSASISGELRMPARKPEHHHMTGAGELKVLYLLPALIAAPAAVPGPDADAFSMLVRWSLVACVIGGYMMTVSEWAKRKKLPPGEHEDMTERVIGAVMRWFGASAVGWIGTIALFDAFQWQISIWRVIGTGFLLGLVGWQLAIWAMPKVLKRGKKIVGGFLESAGPDSDPPT